jgi:hypothetical protein
MFTIQLRNLPEETYLAIKASAKVSKRSMTKEALVLIEKGLKISTYKPQTKAEAFARLKELSSENPVEGGLKQILDYIQEDRAR